MGEDTFSSSLAKLILTQKQMLADMRAITPNIDQLNGLTKFINTLKSLQGELSTFISTDPTAPQPRKAKQTLQKVVQNDREMAYSVDHKIQQKQLQLNHKFNQLFYELERLGDPTLFMYIEQVMPNTAISKEELLFYSYTLAENNNRRIWLILQELEKSPFVSFDSVCPIAITQQININKMSLTNICADVSSCSKVHQLFTPKYSAFKRGFFGWPHGGMGRTGRLPYRERIKREKIKRKLDRTMVEINKIRYPEEDPSKTCTTNKQCDTSKALPMMTRLLWYQVNELLFQKMCPKNCQNGHCNVAATFEAVMKDVERLILFASTFPSYMRHTWNPFFIKALSVKAFSNVDTALSVIKEKSADFKISLGQCAEIKFPKGCEYSALYQQYNLIKKVQQKNSNRDNDVKDLRHFSQMDFKQMIHLQKDNMQHLELLGSIKTLDDNLQASVSGISRYFEGLAKFDEGIAKADVGFIKGELDKYKKALEKVETKIANSFDEGMKLMLSILSLNVVEESAKLAASVISNSNPLKVIFSSPDVVDVMDRAGSIANAASNLVKGSALILSLKALGLDTRNLAAAFLDNSKQIKSMTRVVDKIKLGQGNDIGADADTFLKEYGDYTPKMDRSTLAANDALWSAFKDAMCDILNGDVGVGGSIPKSIAGGKLLCERLDGSLAQFFTLREDIFDFQFQMVDALAAVTRGNIAKRFAQNIKGKYDTLPASYFMTGFMMMQSKIQTVCSVFCDVLEYKNLGKPVTPCSTAGGLYRKENIDSLIAFSDQTPYDEVDRKVFIPTRSGSKGDTGVVDLQALAKGETVIFKVPVDRDWLTNHGWILPYEKAIPFVKSIQLFLPHRNYTNQAFISTTVTLSSVAGSAVSVATPNTGAVYILPKELNVYRTIYHEGYSSCKNEIDNPYSLCKNLPKICDITRRMTGNNILPTVLSTFSLQAVSYRGPMKINYDAPAHETQLLLRAKATLKIPYLAKKKAVVPPQIPKRSDVAVSQDGCCTDNRYRTSVYTDDCSPCPKETIAMLGGLYCQPNDAQ